MNRKDVVVDLYPEDLQFSVYSSEEIKKLSVVKIITELTFNSLGRPLPGGLYDYAMGVAGNSFDVCTTCLGSENNCSGHFGHIELNVLAYNPFFIKLVYDIIRISCLQCYQIQIHDHVEKIVKLQLDLIDAGYIIQAQEIDIFKSEMVASQFEKAIKTEDGDSLHPKIAEMYELLEREGKDTNNKTKTSCGVRTMIVNRGFNIALSNSKNKRCIHCKHPIRSVRYMFRKLIHTVTKSEREAHLNESDRNNSSKFEPSNKVILADECRDYLRSIFNNCSELLLKIYPILQHAISNQTLENPVDIFFSNVIPVTPPKTRPCNILLGQIVEHPQTKIYRTIIQNNSVLRLIFSNIKKGNENLKDEAKVIFDNAKGSTPLEKMYNAWQDLQVAIDQLLDTSTGIDKSSAFGLKQVLEKKEGLLRKHMMGKRVNYAARTVITPDPNINVEELGVPDIFARKLSFPVPVTSWNISELRKMVINGPENHPGANYIEDEKGYKTMIPANDPSKRQSLAKLLLTNPENGIKVVHRHLLNGDILLLNRQPTLHRPSIMAHKARILQNEKTFRLHYSNCKAYNADFDGDEMNAHFPQSEVARSEAYNIVNVANQYLVPKDGTPLGGLIQDHVISGVKLSLRGRFFNREDYQQLVYQGLSHIRGNIKLLPPTILKPIRLWSGKQILSTIVLNLIPDGCPAICLTSTAKVGAKTWNTGPIHRTTYGGTQLGENDMSESEVIIRNGELLSGILDKQQYGATQYGLVHCMYELYGGNCSTNFLTSLTKLFTFFLQLEGFTLGVHDILVTREADIERRKIIRESRDAGLSIVASALDVEESIEMPELIEKIDDAYVKNPKFRLMLDRKYKPILDGYTNDINRTCLPNGLVSKFPLNNLQLMVLSGAKGSMVNTMQISCLLGQIELEGKRPPLMISGKSLPSFSTYETSPKSGGFIDGRFMTGIQPQDFFFHCMAGREGLIDTAVKTSRSGYLQRCLIKHLEGLSIGYDLTVRDSDNCVVQFLYGEDGMDITKASFFNSKCMKFLDDNANAILNSPDIDKFKDDELFQKLQKYNKKIRTWTKKRGNPQLKQRCSSFKEFSAELSNELEVENPHKLNSKNGRLKQDLAIIKLWKKADQDQKKKYDKKFQRCPDPLISKYKPDNNYGSISEYLETLMQQYVDLNPGRKSKIRDIIYVKSMKSMVEPGESVGLLAAQSIGEPSTQMTLNTFHFAGRGEMNVTLGIPRLREILMLASSNIKTPSMDIPFKLKQIKKAEKLRIKFNKVTLGDVLQDIRVKTRLILSPLRAFEYTLHFTFLPPKAYEDEFCVKPKNILKYMNETFFKSIIRAISKPTGSKQPDVEVTSTEKGQPKDEDDDYSPAGDNDEEKLANKKSRTREIEDSSDEEQDDDDATGMRLKSKKVDENEYDDPEVEEELSDANDDEVNDDNHSHLDNSEEKHSIDNEDELDSTILSHQMVKEYVYDQENYSWCKLTFNLGLKYKKLDISTILKNLAYNSVIYQVPNIKRAITYKHNNDLILKTEGINIVEMFKYNKILELNRLYSNDIHSIAATYGIEAAARVIVKEVKNVFSVYGITVDSRHLLLIADYMTFEGEFKPLSRKGMEHSASPLQQMTFESTLSFLKSATVSGRQDDLDSPSSRLMVGLPVRNGTGSFTLLSGIV